VWSILDVASTAPPNQIPFQSPAAGVAAADENTIGAPIVPFAISAPRAGSVPVAASMRIVPPGEKRSLTPGSIVSVARPVTPPTSRVRFGLMPIQYGTPRSWIVASSTIASGPPVARTTISGN
jgi:hypothetical protein